MLAISIISIISIALNNYILSRYDGYTLLGVNFEADQVNDKEVNALTSKFRKWSNISGLILILLDILTYKFLGYKSQVYFLIPAVVAYLILTYIIFRKVQDELFTIKHDRSWDDEDGILYVDTSVLTQKSKKRPLAYIITWLIWLIWPVSIIYQSSLEGGRSLDFVSFIGPISMLAFPLLFFLVNASHNPISEDSSINISYNNELNKNNTRTYLFIFAFCQIMMVFMTYGSALSDISFFIPLSILVFGIILIAFIQISHQARIEKKYAKYKTIKATNNLKYYKYGVYKNKNDSRIMVPKRIPAYGWTINLGNKAGMIVGLVIILIVVALIGGLIFLSSKDIEYNFLDKKLEIKAPMYDRMLSYSDIEEIRLSDEKISAFRVNGYGGSKKSYGHFDVKGYGNTMYYCYNNISQRIFIKVKGKHEKWYILNDKSLEKTQKIYNELKDRVKQ